MALNLARFEKDLDALISLGNELEASMTISAFQKEDVEKITKGKIDDKQ